MVITAQDKVSARDVARQLDISHKTVIRWIRHGCRGRKLSGQRVGNEWWTTWRDVDAFGEDGPAVVAEACGGGRCRRDAEQAAAEDRLRREFGINLGR